MYTKNATMYFFFFIMQSFEYFRTLEQICLNTISNIIYQLSMEY